ncbi:MAG: YadA-like family protein, partial [Negativicutes bacterium]
GVAPTDAVNVRQLKRESSRIDKVGSLAAAMSGLAPLSYKEDQPTQVAVATGMYSGENALAAGIYHYTKEDVLLNAAFAISGSEKMGRAGLTVRLKKSKDKEQNSAPADPLAPITPVAPVTPANPVVPASPKAQSVVPEQVPVTAVTPEAVETMAQVSINESDSAITDNEVKG